MNVLFRSSYIQFDFVAGIIWIVCVAFFIAMWINFTRKNNHRGLILTVLITIIFGSVAIYTTVQLIRATVNMIATATRTDYHIVVGYVEDYRLTPNGAHNKESFEIDGVQFSYPPSGNTWFYHTTRDEGGVVRGNGQYLEIRYFTDTVKQGNKTVELNCIIYIAEDAEKSMDIDE